MNKKGITMIRKNETVYLAGPMSGRPLYNHVWFFGFAGMLEKEYSCRVLNPARQPHGLPYQVYMDRAMLDLVEADTVLMLTGWEHSPGARQEFRVAQAGKKRILYELAVALDIQNRMKQAERRNSGRFRNIWNALWKRG